MLEADCLKKIIALFIIFFAFLLSACALAPKGGVTPQGQVLVYLQAGGPPTYEINFSLDQVWLEGKTGAKFPLGFQTQHISSLSLLSAASGSRIVHL